MCYFPIGYLEELEVEVGKLLQKSREPVAIFIKDLQTLIRHYGGMTGDKRMRWLHCNLLLEYRLYGNLDYAYNVFS